MKIKKTLKIITFSLVGAALVAAAAFGIYAGTIDYPALDTNLLNSVTQSVFLTDINGEPINGGRSADKKISVGNLPDHVKSAFLAAEDKRFYNHKGFDYRRMLSAISKNIMSLSFKEGASTISQQVIKNTHLSSEKTITRKLKEARLTKTLEKKYSKEDIFNIYLNYIYFGNGAYGLNAAAHTYFGKEAAELTLPEAAMLAGVINSPTRYNPLNNYQGAKTRQATVLRLMAKNGYITKEDLDNSLNYDIELGASAETKTEKYLAAALTEAESHMSYIGLKSLSGLTINTYLDPDMQQALGNNLSTQSQHAKNSNGILPEHMGIITDVGDRGVRAFYCTDKVNIDSKRQPASALKPFSVYLPSLEFGLISPATPLLDMPVNYQGYRPQNYNNKHWGWISVREAVGNSNNVIAVKLLEQIGLDSAHKYCAKVGLDLSASDNNLSVALGGLSQGVRLLDLTNAYASLADGGLYSSPSFIKSITGANGEILYSHNPVKTQVLKSDSVYLMTDMLKDNAKSGTAQRLKPLNYDIAAKTGTGGEAGKANTDAYCMSYTSELSIGIWMGGADNTAANLLDSTVAGSTYPTIVTKLVLENIYDRRHPPKFETPNNIVFLDIDKNLYNNEHIIALADSAAPAIHRRTEVFSTNNLPQKLIDKNIYAQPAQPAPPKNNNTAEKRKNFVDRIKGFFAHPKTKVKN